MDGELDQDRKQDVEVEDVAQRSLARQLLDRLQITRGATVRVSRVARERQGG